MGVSLGILSPLLSDLAKFIWQWFTMFMQLLTGIIVAPIKALANFFQTWGKSLSNYGLIIPLIIVAVLGISLLFFYLIIFIHGTLNAVTNPMGGVEGE